MYKLKIYYNHDGDYRAILYYKILWFIWFPVSMDGAFSGDNFFIKDLKKQIKKWIKHHGKNMQIVNLTDLAIPTDEVAPGPTKDILPNIFKIWILLPLVLFASCGEGKKERVTAMHYTVEFEGHRYLCYEAGGIIHLESCICKTRRVINSWGNASDTVHINARIHGNN